MVLKLIVGTEDIAQECTCSIILLWKKDLELRGELASQFTVAWKKLFFLPKLLF